MFFGGVGAVALKRNEGAEEGGALGGGADGGRAEVPAGVGGEGNGLLGEADAAAVVAVGVGLGDEGGVEAGDLWRLTGENSGAPVGAKVEVFPLAGGGG